MGLTVAVAVAVAGVTDGAMIGMAGVGESFRSFSSFLFKFFPLALPFAPFDLIIHTIALGGRRMLSGVVIIGGIIITFVPSNATSMPLDTRSSEHDSHSPDRRPQ